MFTGPNIVTEGLVLALDAGNKKSYPGSGNTWYDLSGNGINATLYNTPNFTGNTFEFDGTNQYGVINSSYLRNVHNSGEVTYQVTFNQQSGGFIFGRRLPSGGGGFTGCQYEPVITTSGVNLSGCSNSGRVNNNEFYSKENSFNQVSVAFSEDDNTTFLKSNEDIINSLTPSQIKNNSNYSNLVFSAQSFNEIFIAGSWTTYGNISSFYNVEIGSIRIYNRALTPQEVQQNYNATKSRFGLT